MKKQQKPESTTTSSLDEDDGLTPEQRRTEWMRTATHENIDWLSRHDLQKKCNGYASEKYLESHHHTISRMHPRDITTGTYVGAGEAFHRNVLKACEKGQTPDDNAMELLLNGQPWRKALAAAPNREQPVVTYGPMQLPESYDPIASLEADPAVEIRPTHWTPDTPASHIISGAVHDFGNYLSALIARQVVALGFTPDTEAIANARSLARTLKDFQTISQLEEETRADKPRKTSPGRPRKTTVIDPEKVLTLRLEIIERNKNAFNTSKSRDPQG